MKIILLSFLFAASLAAPKPTKLSLRNLFRPESRPISPRIMGGVLAAPHSIPYQAFIEFYSKHSGEFCGGSLISQNYVLSSRYCAAIALEALVTLGAHNIYNTELSQINVYSTNIVNNSEISIVKLPSPVEFTDAIQPATLPKRSDVNTNYIGRIARISGWGSDNNYDDSIFDILRYADLQVVNCDEHESESSFCAYEDDESSCFGDDGGPVVVDGVVVAVINLENMMYCIPEFTLWSVRIDRYLDWIGDNSDVLIE